MLWKEGIVSLSSSEPLEVGAFHYDAHCRGFSRVIVVWNGFCFIILRIELALPSEM